MPSRPDSHAIADIAVTSVMRVFSQCGWAAEVVQKDYGEDILVLPSYREKMDPCRIWVQVKGTRNVSQFWHGGEYLYPVSIDHARRWIRSADLVVVVLWDVTNDSGYWCVPIEDEQDWAFDPLTKKTTNIKFNPEHVFDEEAAWLVGWKSRLRHYELLFKDAMARDHYAESIPAIHPEHRSLIPIVAYEFLTLIEIIDEENNSISEKDFERWIKTLRMKVKSLDELPKVPDFLLHAAAFATVMDRIAEITGDRSVRDSILDPCSLYLSRLLKLTYGQEIIDAMMDVNNPVFLKQSDMKSRVPQHRGSQIP